MGKLKITRYIIALIIMVGLMLTATGGSAVMAAPGDPVIKYKNVHLWVSPEYDSPSLLVMMQGQLDGVTAPVKVTFLVPTTAVMYSAGSIDASGKYTGGPPDRAVSSIAGCDEISYTVTTDTFRVEYYNDIIQGLPEKIINYEFKTLYPITQLTAFIQKPKTATNFTVTPAGTAGTDSEGLTIQTISYPTVAVESPLLFKISYTKADNTTSIATSSTNTTAAGTGSVSPWLIIVPFLLIATIIGAIMWNINSKKSRKKTPVKAAGNNPPNPPVNKRKGSFCPECGEPTTATKFCPNCGTKL
jgi:hypothetical protein